jgi:hypothetical protein
MKKSCEKRGWATLQMKIAHDQTGGLSGIYAAPANASVAWAYFCREISSFAGA